MRKFVQIIVAILAILFLAACGITHFQVSEAWGTDNEIGLFVAVFGGIAVLGLALNGAAALMHRDWRGFVGISTMLLLGWGGLALSNWLFNNHDIVPHIELSAFVFVLSLILSPAIAAAVAGE